MNAAIYAHPRIIVSVTMLYNPKRNPQKRFPPAVAMPPETIVKGKINFHHSDAMAVVLCTWLQVGY